MAIEPKGIIVHSMSEYFERDALKWLSRYNKETNTFDGTPLDQYPNPIHATDWLVYSRLSVHGFISPNGDWIAGRAVPEKAAHAGKSVFGNLSGLNNHFLGIEMLVPGVNNYSQFINKIATPGTFSSAQRETALAKCREWMGNYNISSNAVVGHSEVSGDDVRGPGKGKRDPGSSFDMDAFRGDL